jgi:hypothetical protein
VSGQVSPRQAAIGSAVIGVVAALLGSFLGVAGASAIDRRAATRSACANFLSASSELEKVFADISERFAQANLADAATRQRLSGDVKAFNEKATTWERAAFEVQLIAGPELLDAIHSYIAKAKEAAKPLTSLGGAGPHTNRATRGAPRRQGQGRVRMPASS